MDRRRWAGQIVDLVHLDIEWERYVVAHQLKPRIADQMEDIVFGTCEKVIGTDHIVALTQQTITQMRA